MALAQCIGVMGLDAAASGAFSPADLAGLAVWLKADAGTLQTAGGAAASADGDPVGQWQDQSGNGWHFAQATAAKRGTLKLNIQNGRPVVRLDGVDDYLSSTAVSLASGSHAVFAALTPATNDGTTRPVLDTELGRLLFAMRTVAGTHVGWFDGAYKDIAVVAAGFQVLGWTLTSGGNGEVWRDGVSLGTAAYTARAWGGETVIGAFIGGTTNFSACDIGEIIVVEGGVTAGERQQVEDYLRDRWGTP